MDDNFIVTPKNERSETITLRLDTQMNQRLEELARKSGRSRNELVNLALKFALDKMKFVEDE